eukprot:scaffold230749_cov32-Tisochrysis_lutea.AAC.2
MPPRPLAKGAEELGGGTGGLLSVTSWLLARCDERTSWGPRARSCSPGTSSRVAMSPCPIGLAAVLATRSAIPLAPLPPLSAGPSAPPPP